MNALFFNQSDVVNFYLNDDISWHRVQMQNISNHFHRVELRSMI